MVKEQNKRFWTERAPGIDIGSAPVGSLEFYAQVDAHRRRYESYAIELIRVIAIPGERVLEVGCGLGSDSREFARLGMKTVSADLSQSNVVHTKRGFETQGLAGAFVVADAEHLPFSSGAFHVAYSFGVLHHTPDTAGAVQQLARVLRPRGKCLVMLYHKGAAFWWILLRSVFSGEFFRMTLEQSISKHYDHTPLSKMYSRREARTFFSSFRAVKIRCINFGGVQNHPLLRWYWKLLTSFPGLLDRLGSFLIIKGEK